MSTFLHRPRLGSARGPQRPAALSHYFAGPSSAGPSSAGPSCDRWGGAPGRADRLPGGLGAWIAVWLTSFFLVGGAAAHDPVSEMTESAQRLMALLDEPQRAKCLQALEGTGRETWNFVPDRFIEPGGARLGLPISEMTSQQRLLTHALLSTALSNQGYRKTVSIMALEQVLFELENRNPIRNPELYYLSIYGQPDHRGTWGWRFEGHHLSLNFTIMEGKQVALTPAFFGTNPAEVRQGPLQGLRVLADEEDLGRQFMQSLSAAQQAKATVRQDVPADILSGNQPQIEADLFAATAGIGYEDLLPEQQRKLLRVVEHYSGNFHSGLIDDLSARKPLTDGQGLKFVWIGDLTPGAAHYYRLQSPTYVFEYDNTQNDANHIHSVWREFGGDFGRDLLRTHYQEHHSKSTTSRKP